MKIIINNECDFENAINSKQNIIEINNCFEITKTYKIDFDTTIFSKNKIDLNISDNLLDCCFNITKNVNFKNISFNGNNNIKRNESFIINSGNLTLDKININNFNSKCNGAAICLNKKSILNIINFSTINNCESDLNGGAIYSNNSTVYMHNAYLESNKANNGGGMYIENNSYCLIDFSSIIKNTANINGGGICINDNNHVSTVTFKSFNSMYYNKAINGIDIYNDGILELYSYNAFNDGIYLCSDKNELKIKDTLNNSKISIEKSKHIDPLSNKSILTIAKCTESYPRLNNYDMDSIIIPNELFDNWELNKNESNDEVILKDINTYNISYTNTKDAINPNPKTYKIDDLPIVLKPLNKDGFIFTNFTNPDNIIVSTIPSGFKSDITLKANWENIEYKNINFDSNTKDIVNDMPQNTKVKCNSNIIVSDSIPKRRGYIFLNWNKKNDDSSTKIYPNQELKKINEDIVLYAIWYKLPYICFCCNPICICCKCKHKLHK